LPNNLNVKILSMTLVTPVDGPTGLTATATSSTEVNLAWTAPTTGTVTGYNVFRGTTSGGESLVPLNSTPLSASATSYSDTTAEPGNIYFYVVQSLSSSSPVLSNQASATTPVSPPDATSSEVDLNGLFNQEGIVSDGSKFSGGLDGAGNALSGNQLGTSQTIGGVAFAIGTANTNNVVTALGQTIGLPNGLVSQVQILATAVNGDQSNQTFTVNFTDGSSQTFTENVNDWFTPGSESAAVSTSYRDTGNGGRDSHDYSLYLYTLNVTDSGKTVQSVSLPDDPNVKVVAISTVAATNAPTALTASTKSSSEIDLSWTAPASGTVTGYNIYRGTLAGGESATPLNATPLSASTTTFQDTAVQTGNTYFYVVQAIINGAPSKASNEASATATVSGTTAAADLTGLFNQQGIVDDGSKVPSPGIDWAGNAISANLIGTSQTVGGTTFNIASPGANNVIMALGQTVGVPNGNYSQIELLAFGVNGNQLNQPFTVHYTDGTTATFTQNLSDWHTAQGFTNESIGLAMPYRDTASGGRDNRAFNVYAYTFSIDNSKTIASITLPNDGHVKVLAITLVQ
jgi:titin